nr:uncharacterized protein At4g38062-like [Ipomoea batatas]GMD00664.1 uncharacterized protein At4g38062-like [Ipomoea batatas]
MGTVHEKLEEAMAENEKLRKEHQMKAESMENLRRAYDEQLMKGQDGSSKVEKLTLELSLKEEELSAANQKFEELKANLKEKESAIKHLSSANDRLRAESAEKARKFEEENREMVRALDEANAVKMDQNQQIQSLRNENGRLREMVSASQKMCSEAEERAKACRELRQRDEILFKLEEEKIKLEDELKWKKEQFCHLVEAHENLQKKFREREKELEEEKETLFDHISTLQSTLDSQTRISEDFRTRLQMCNQALAHEETRRKFMEAQLSESKSCIDSVSAEYEEAKSRIDGLCAQRDKEIANLRDAMGSREAIYKETEYRFRKLEQEKQELMASLKEFQEAGIKASGNSSLSKLRNKLKAKEAQWASEMEGLAGDLDCCKSELKNKDGLITELQKELQSCHSLMFELTLQNEETSVMLLVLKSHLSEVYQSLANAYAAVDFKNKEDELHISTLMQQLDEKNSTLVIAEKDLEDERHKVAALSARIESLNLIDEEQVPLQTEVDKLKEMLKEASAYQEHLKEQVMRTESDLTEAQDALDRANEELADVLYEGNEAVFELQIWRTIAERLKSSLDENLIMRRKVEDSLFAQMHVEIDLRQEKDSLIANLAEKETETTDLKQKIALLNQELEKRDLQKELEWLREELEGSILAQQEAERIHEKEKASFHHRIEDLQRLVLSLEQEFENTTSNFFSRLLQMQAETDKFRQTWETVTEAVVLKEIEIQETNMINSELENDFTTLKQKIEQQNRRLSTLSSNLGNQTSNSDREMLLDMLTGLSDRMSQLSMDDKQLTKELGRIMLSFNSNGGLRANEFFDPVKENLNRCPPPTKTVEAAMAGERSPLRALNN